MRATARGSAHQRARVADPEAREVAPPPPAEMGFAREQRKELVQLNELNREGDSARGEDEPCRERRDGDAGVVLLREVAGSRHGSRMCDGGW